MRAVACQITDEVVEETMNDLNDLDDFMAFDIITNGDKRRGSGGCCGSTALMLLLMVVVPVVLVGQTLF